MVTFKNNKNTILSNDEFKINLKLNNVGTGDINLLYDLSYILKLKTNDKTLNVASFNLSELSSKSDLEYSFSIPKLNKGSYNFVLYQKQFNTEIPIAYENIVVSEGYNIDNNNYPSIENSNLKLVLYGENNLIKEGHLFSKKDNIFMGTIDFGYLSLYSNESIKLDGFTYKIVGNKVLLTKSNSSYNIENIWTLEDMGLYMSHKITAMKNLNIYLYDGPVFLAFDRSFGYIKDSGVFPGIDYLDNEPSNNTLAINPPFHNRWAPHPKKITIPVISIERDDIIVSYSWDHLGNWTDNLNLPGVYLQSPNFQMKDYHEMGVFAPSIPDYTDENSKIASKPFLLNSNNIIHLRVK